MSLTPASLPAPQPRRGGARILPRAFYDRPVLEVARDLLGMILVRADRGGRLSGRIVEVEAYDGIADLACHASKGRTARTEPMFGEAGRAYIYMVYGMHHCLNVVTGPAGHPAAVLVRALEPVEGGGWMARAAGPRRKVTGGPVPPLQIAAGPGRLTCVFGIDLSLNRTDLCAPGDLLIEAGEPVPDGQVLRGPRIGVEYAGAWARKPWRFGVRGSKALSRPFPVGRSSGGTGRNP